MHCLHLSLDKVEDDILARHNKHSLSPCPQGCNHVTSPKAQHAQGIESFDQCSNKHSNLFNLQTKIYPLAMFQLSKLSTARNNCQPFSPLCVTE